MKSTSSALVYLLLSATTWAIPLEQFTPDLADWTTQNDKAVLNNLKNTDHSPDGIFWIDESDWLPWDGTVYNASEYSRSEFAQKICTGNTIRGLREVFYDNNPFSDIVNPTKAEVDNWHMIAVNHVRAMVGYTEDEYQIQPDKCLHIRAMWSDERMNTRKWDTDDYPGTCLETTNPHCGAGFMPSKEDQQPYLPDDIDECPKLAGSEGIFNSAKSNIPWSIKWARPFCYTLGAEGFWGGHTGPWFHRGRFGWSWWDPEPDNTNSNVNLRTKWAGARLTNKYIDPQVTAGDHLVLVENVDPNPRFPSFQCLQSKWTSGVKNATHCYHTTMDNPDCGKRFMTYVNGGGCACYPVDMDICVPANAANRGTWDFNPRVSSFDGLMIDVENPLWKGRRCDNIQWKTKSGDATQCLEKLMDAQYPDCAKNFMTWNAADGGCACYPPEQTSCEKSDTKSDGWGRMTYELMVDPSYEPPTTLPPGTTSSPTTSTDSPTTAPSVSPTKSPVEADTSSPTAGVDCTQSDDDEFLYKVKNNDKVVTKTCGWLANKSKSKKRKICKKTVAHMIEYAPPQVTCKIACNSCHPCYENPKSEWFFKKKKNGEVNLKTCKYLAKKTEKDELCDDRTATNGGYSGPAVHCPATCGVGSCEA